MQDDRIVSALTAATAIEQDARRTWAETEDLPDRDAALIVGRHATALRRSLEGWIARRAQRAQLRRVG